MSRIVLISGGFRGQGGSVTRPALAPLDGTVLEIRDIPRAAVAGMLAAGELTLGDGTGPDTAALLSERVRLLARLTEIDATLAARGHDPHDRGTDP
ncbi:hypothetical protein ACFWUQ_09000 [Streptomyces sp. NPDC058662]|uniref:hypothetical protein n=1 Tax=Streptomyces sp. NPDC058662 TaxID=3346583 RepID=UPI00366606DE